MKRIRNIYGLFITLNLLGCATYSPPSVEENNVESVTCEESFYKLKKGMSLKEVESLVGTVSVLSPISAKAMAENRTIVFKTQIGVFQFDESLMLLNWQSEICP